MPRPVVVVRRREQVLRWDAPDIHAGAPNGRTLDDRGSGAKHRSPDGGGEGRASAPEHE